MLLPCHSICTIRFFKLSRCCAVNVLNDGWGSLFCGLRDSSTRRAGIWWRDGACVTVRAASAAAAIMSLILYSVDAYLSRVAISVYVNEYMLVLPEYSTDNSYCRPLVGLRTFSLIRLVLIRCMPETYSPSNTRCHGANSLRVLGEVWGWFVGFIGERLRILQKCCSILK